MNYECLDVCSREHLGYLLVCVMSFRFSLVCGYTNVVMIHSLLNVAYYCRAGLFILISETV
jgi:hypothetical protein